MRARGVYVSWLEHHTEIPSPFSESPKRQSPRLARPARARRPPAGRLVMAPIRPTWKCRAESPADSERLGSYPTHWETRGKAGPTRTCPASRPRVGSSDPALSLCTSVSASPSPPDRLRSSASSQRPDPAGQTGLGNSAGGGLESLADSRSSRSRLGWPGQGPDPQFEVQAGPGPLDPGVPGRGPAVTGGPGYSPATARGRDKRNRCRAGPGRLGPGRGCRGRSERGGGRWALRQRR